MRPRRRYLKGNAGTEAPTSLLFFDTESHARTYGPGGLRTDLTLRLWSACYVRREGTTFRDPIWYRGTTAGEFWMLLESYGSWRRPLWVFAHNLGHDLTQVDFWSALEHKLWTPGPCPRPYDFKRDRQPPPWRGRMCLESRPTFLVLKGKHGFYKLVDTTNYWQLELKALGKPLGLRKLKVDFARVNDERLQRYCDRDVEITRAAVCNLLRWWIEHDCGTFQLTGPMCAMTNWRHTTTARAKEGKTTSVVLEEDSPARKDEREACHGARVEAFYVGKWRGKLYHLDCNSLYPFVMRDALFPRARVRSLQGCNLSELRDYADAYGLVAAVILDTGRSGATYPIRANGVQVHATGRFATHLCGPELVRAIRSGHVVEAQDVHLYSLAPLFTDWCDTWLERRRLARLAKDKAHEHFIQLILRSLAGKWAQRGDVWKDTDQGPERRGWGRTVEMDHDTKQLTQYRWVAGNTQAKVPGEEPLNAFPSIFGFICGYAREYMQSVFARMPDRSVLYTATDSIICTPEGFQALREAGLLHPSQPGKFKLKGTARSAEILGPNWYRFGREWTIGGFWGRAKKDDKGEWYCDVWDRLGSLLQSNPHGVCGYTRTPLQAMKATVKNDPAGHGWRRPFRYTADHEFTDKAPTRPHPALRDQG